MNEHGHANANANVQAHEGMHENALDHHDSSARDTRAITSTNPYS